MKVLRYRLYPTKSQRSKMADTLELCRQTYKETLAVRRNAYIQEGKSVSYYETKKLLPQWKDDKPELKSIHSQVLQEVVKRVDLAYQAFFRSNMGCSPVISLMRSRNSVQLRRLKCAYDCAIPMRNEKAFSGKTLNRSSSVQSSPAARTKS